MLDFKKYGKAEKALRFFEEFSRIPRGSGNTAAIADYLIDFAKERGLYYHKDSANNVIIRKAATRGYENEPTIILQGHTDMVAECEPGSGIDMTRDPLELYIDGDFLRAKKTTLGGDDGVAIAYALAILDSDDIAHPEFEAVFTSDEETGLDGANALDCSLLHGKMLINVDSDAEGIFTVGCAGGLRMDVKLPIKREAYGDFAYHIRLDGLQGGHSGVEINKGRLNAMRELNKVIMAIPGARVVSFSGGNMDNAIPRLAEAVIRTEARIVNEEEFVESFLSARRTAEPDIALDIVMLSETGLPLDDDSNVKLATGINMNRTGVIAMSKDIEGLVETSMNLGILRTEDDHIRISYSLRSSREIEKLKLKVRVRGIYEGLGAEVSERGEYPAWEYKRDSVLRDTMCEVYRETYGKDAEVITIHAGLECGIFSGKMEGLDCVSIGPDSFDIHTTEERLSLPSFERVYNYIIKVLGYRRSK